MQRVVYGSCQQPSSFWGRLRFLMLCLLCSIYTIRAGCGPYECMLVHALINETLARQSSATYNICISVMGEAGAHPSLHESAGRITSCHCTFNYARAHGDIWGLHTGGSCLRRFGCVVCRPADNGAFPFRWEFNNWGQRIVWQLDEQPVRAEGCRYPCNKHTIFSLVCVSS